MKEDVERALFWGPGLRDQPEPPTRTVQRGWMILPTLKILRAWGRALSSPGSWQKMLWPSFLLSPIVPESRVDARQT